MKLCGVIAHTQNSDCAHGKVSVLLGAASWNEVAKVLAAVCSKNNLSNLIAFEKVTPNTGTIPATTCSQLPSLGA